MNADRLLAYYERIADAPDAIVCFRRFILDLAVRGKLVEQEPNDEPASELLKRIATKKARLVKTRKTKSRDLLNGVNSDEFPFGIPAAWCWVRFGNIADYSAGRTPSRNEPSFWNSGDRAWVSIADMKDGETLTSTKETVTKKAARQVFGAEPEQIGTIIMSFKLTIGKIARLGIPAYHNEAIISIRPYVSDLDSHLFKVLPIFARQGNTKGAIKGATLNRKSISNILIPLPPLAEQHRIVAKVNELIALCDRLEAARAEREATRDRLSAAILAHLDVPDPDPTVFQGHAAFALQNFAPLTTRSDQIKALRQTILNLAVRGKLVEQDPNDEPASELLKRAEMTKAEATIERKIRKNSEPELSESAGENGSPSHWVWAYLHDFALVLGGKRLPSDASLSHEQTGNIYIRVTDMKDGSISAEDLQYISDDVRARIAKYTIDREDLYITIAGTIGEVGEVPERFHGQNLTENAAKIVFREVDRKFLLLVLRSNDVQEQFQEKTKQMAQPKLALKRIAGARIPLPPLAEQHRIVAKVDELMALCDRMEINLGIADTGRQHLLESLLRDVLVPSNEPCKVRRQ